MSSKLYFRTKAEHWEPLPDDLYTQCALLCNNCAAGWIIERDLFTGNYYHLTPDETVTDSCDAALLIERHASAVK